MEKVKAYTDLEQSKKLAEILPIESADMYYDVDGYGVRTTPEILVASVVRKKDIPCWSLGALINVLPTTIIFKHDVYTLQFMKEYVEYVNNNVSLTGRCLHTTGNNNLVDACVEMIFKLHENNMLYCSN